MSYNLLTIFRVDVTSKIGLGHFSRCLTLAQHLKKFKYEVYFLGYISQDSVKNQLSELGIKLLLLHEKEQLDSNTAISFIKKIKRTCDFLIVDHYELDKSWHLKLRKVVDKIIVIDDLADRELDCDLLVDQNPGRLETDYDNKIPRNCIRLIGPKYALLKQCFAENKDNSIKNRMKHGYIKKVLVSFGGSDPNNFTKTILSQISKKDIGIEYDVIIRSSFESYFELKKINLPKYIRLHTDIQDIEQFMFSADMAIGSGGVTALERCVIGLPTIVISAAKNQDQQIEALKDAGAITLLPRHLLDDENIIFSLLGKYKNEIQFWKSQITASSLIVDGFGIKRIISVIKTSLRKAKISDCKILFEWQHEPEIRNFSRNQVPPKYEDHEKWYQDKLEDNQTLFYMISYEEKLVGTLRLDKVKSELNDQTYEISIITSTKYQGLGIATASLHLIKALHPQFVFLAEVHKENKASHKIFINSGFIKSNNWYKYCREIL